MAPSQVDHRVAGDVESSVARAVVLEGRAAAVAVPAVELDDQAAIRPVAVGPVALGAEEDPVVEAGKGQAVPAEEGREAFLELAALAPGRLFGQTLEGKRRLREPRLAG